MDLQTLMTMFLSFTIEMLISGIMLIKHPLRFRFKPYISIPIGLLIAFASSFLVIFGLYFFFKPEDWKELLNIASYTIPVIGLFFAFWFAYKISAPQIMLMLAVAYTFQSMAYQWTVIAFETGIQGYLYSTMGEDWYNTYYNLIYNIGTYLIKIGIYVLCYFLIARTYKKYSKYIIKTLNIIIVGVIVYFVINVANVYIVQHITPRLWYWDGAQLQYDGVVRGVLAATLIVFCIIFDTLVVGGFRVMEHRQETMIIKATLQSKVRQQEMMEKNINFINMKCHDLRKELRRLKANKGNLTDEDFCLLEESLNFYDSSIKTGNINIDALIQDKLIYCNSLGIEFTALVDGDAFKEIDASDVYFLLVNIIDNAIEATENIEEKEHRVISLTASRKQGVLFIEETNYFKGDIKFNNDGSIKTTKANAKYHGYGTKSIAYIVKKYDGKVEYNVEDQIFKLKIAIQTILFFLVGQYQDCA